MAIEPNYLKYAEGSALITLGNTRVLCAASIDDKVPNWMKGRGVGWAQFFHWRKEDLDKEPHAAIPVTL